MSDNNSDEKKFRACYKVGFTLIDFEDLKSGDVFVHYAEGDIHAPGTDMERLVGNVYTGDDGLVSAQVEPIAVMSVPVTELIKK